MGCLRESREARTAVADSPQEMLASPAHVAGSPSDYQRFVSESKAELGVAKEGYVTSRSGWFSDRSVCYLAAGRPVLAQDTGFSQYLPTGAGLLGFETTSSTARGVPTSNRP